MNKTKSVSAGLDYPAVGPEHAFLKDSGRAVYVPVSDKQALQAFFEVGVGLIKETRFIGEWWVS